MKRSKKSTNPVRSFLKEWALFGLIIGGIILSRIYLWTPVRVDGHSARSSDALRPADAYGQAGAVHDLPYRCVGRRRAAFRRAVRAGGQLRKPVGRRVYEFVYRRRPIARTLGCRIDRPPRRVRIAGRNGPDISIENR